ncbi:ATP-dependent DNA helicase [Microbacterium sp. cf332]|uniref:ATP-dependent DNA helicase n=1 Tax=Microbacterium sp. cf332 TaxID=1761804 RepID=UPI00088655F3|nr:ATP-dependent DNA helicase [Microbacterium sp. cf332]SDQ07081.1 Superfamily I DNA or RNA helicase [Microbacterium sp. cf332]
MGPLSAGAEPDVAQARVLALPATANAVVVGAPGTGKSRTIVERVRRLVADGADPDGVVVLTATRQAATRLRDDLGVAVGVATAGPLARSATAFAFQIVRAAAVRRGAEPPRLLTGADEDAIVRDLLDGDAEDEAAGVARWPADLPAHVRGSRAFRAELRAFIAECTAAGIDHRALADRAQRERRPAWLAAASFMSEYFGVRDAMRGPHRDAAGLIREAGEIVARHGLPGLRHVLVDDAQELTSGGVDLLEACRSRGVAVLAFGDPDVGSGAFRGATPENFARLAGAGDVLVLDTVHRAEGRHAPLVSTVTARIGAVGLVAHRRAVDPDAPAVGVRALTLRSRSEEFDAVARLLRERHVHHGVPWEECAVIAHDSRQVTALEAELAARDVPTASSGTGTALGDSPVVRDLLRLVDLAARPGDTWTRDEVVAALTGAGLDAVDQRRLRAALRHSFPSTDGDPVSAWELVRSAMLHPAELALLDLREARRAARVAETLRRVHELIADEATAHELLWAAWEGSGRERGMREASRGHGPLAAQADRDLDAVVALFQAAKRHGEREDGTTPIVFLRGILDADVGDDRFVPPPVSGAVRVLTPAAALGTEFDTVVVAGVQEGIWPNLRVRGSLLDTWRLPFDDPAVADALDRRRGVLHDELRLFARALSRAQDLVVVTAVDDDDTGPSPFFELLPDAEGAPPEAAHPLTLRGLVARHRRMLTESHSPHPERERAAGQLALLAAAGVSGASPDEWYGVRPPTTTAPLRDREGETIRVSPSRLETLEECQLNWVIADLGGDAARATAGIGTIVHSALEVASPDEESLWQAVSSRWSELEFESAWRERAERTRARDLVRRLARYLRDFERDGGRLLSAEPRFEVELAHDDGDGRIVLSGAVDRVEQRGDGSVVIVDLKTGKREPQTDRAVTHHAQLAAYQLAHERGAIPAAAGLPSGGAMLLVLRPSAASKDYATPRQPPFGADERAAFLDRLDGAARVMSGVRFEAPFEEHCRDDHSFGLCRIHTIAAVSAT